MFSVMSAHHSVILSRGSHVTITHDASDITMQGIPNSSPPPDMASQTPLLLTSGGQDWRPVQTYSLEDIPSWLPSSGNWNNRYGQCKRTVSILLECFLVTTHKQSLGQGNDFTSVCHSIHRGGGVSPYGRHPPVEMAIKAGGMHPTGMYSCVVK